jgi:hypothetical protein
MKKLTEATLRQILHYDPATGVFARYPAPGGRGRTIVGTPDTDGYLTIGINGGRYRASRLAWLWMTGHWPPSGFQIDHINRNRADDRWDNLQLATWSDQQFNKGIAKNNKTGRTGVFIAKNNKYGASVGKKYLGVFKTVEDAAAARERYIKETKGAKKRIERDWLFVATKPFPGDEHVKQIRDRIGQSSQ